MAMPRASPLSACRWWRTACRALPGRSPACSPGSAGRAHPVFGLWPVALRDELRRAMVEEGMRKVDVWTARYALVAVDFAAAPVDPFFNANRPEDLAEAERLAAALRPVSAAATAHPRSRW